MIDIVKIKACAWEAGMFNDPKLLISLKNGEEIPMFEMEINIAHIVIVKDVSCCSKSYTMIRTVLGDLLTSKTRVDVILDIRLSCF